MAQVALSRNITEISPCSDDQKTVSAKSNRLANNAADYTLRARTREIIQKYLDHLGNSQVNDLHSLVFKEVEIPLLEGVLKHLDNNQSKAAEMLGISRSTLRKKLKQYGIS